MKIRREGVTTYDAYETTTTTKEDSQEIQVGCLVTWETGEMLYPLSSLFILSFFLKFLIEIQSKHEKSRGWKRWAGVRTKSSLNLQKKQWASEKTDDDDSNNQYDLHPPASGLHKFSSRQNLKGVLFSVSTLSFCNFGSFSVSISRLLIKEKGLTTTKTSPFSLSSEPGTLFNNILSTSSSKSAWGSRSVSRNRKRREWQAYFSCPLHWREGEAATRKSSCLMHR